MHANVCVAIMLIFGCSQLDAADSFRGEKLIKWMRMRTVAWVHFTHKKKLSRANIPGDEVTYRNSLPF